MRARTCVLAVVMMGVLAGCVMPDAADPKFKFTKNWFGAEAEWSMDGSIQDANGVYNPETGEVRFGVGTVSANPSDTRIANVEQMKVQTEAIRIQTEGWVKTIDRLSLMNERIAERLENVVRGSTIDTPIGSARLGTPIEPAGPPAPVTEAATQSVPATPQLESQTDVAVEQIADILMNRSLSVDDRAAEAVAVLMKCYGLTSVQAETMWEKLCSPETNIGKLMASLDALMGPLPTTQATKEE